MTTAYTDGIYALFLTEEKLSANNYDSLSRRNFKIQNLKIFATNNHYKLNEDVYDKFMMKLAKESRINGNGRYVRNQFEGSRLRQSERLMKLSKKQRKKELFILAGSDFVDYEDEL